MAEANYKPAIKQIHTDTVHRVKEELGPNPVLGLLTPLISPSERSLPRLHRSTLAQLRSGHCALLESYKMRVGQACSAICSECQFSRRTTTHLFNCPATQTHLSVSDLWHNPVDAVDFLLSLPSFPSLRPPRPLPPPPPLSPPSAFTTIDRPWLYSIDS